MKVTIRENERGLLFKNGRYIRLLEPGKHRYLGSAYVALVLDTDRAFLPKDYNPELFLRDPALAALLEVVEVPDEAVALHYIDGRFDRALLSGRHVFWRVSRKHEFKLVDIREPLAGADIPAHVFRGIPEAVCSTVEVPEGRKGLLYYDGRFVRLLDSGVYHLWQNGVRARVELADTRLQQMSIQGQELLTLDKVTLRLNLVLRYRVTDCLRAYTELSDPEEQLRVTAQLALREYVGHSRLDELLENKERIAEFVLDRMKRREQEFAVAFVDAGIKDIILPGEIREIMNTVLVAEKTAQANVITRREEVASTRSLLNTAKLMDENKTLMRLKEMEYLEKICAGVGNITVNGGSDLLGQLAALMKGAG